MERYSINATNAALGDLARDGGGTYNRDDLSPFRPIAGYAVAVGGVELAYGGVTGDVLGWAADAVASEFSTHLVGTWLDDGIVYIDAVRHIRNRETAIKLGQDAGQQAIYDFATGESITLGQES